MFNRRKFLQASAAGLMLYGLPRVAMGNTASGESKRLVFDAMGELRPTYSRALLTKILQSGLNAITVTLTDPKVFEQDAYQEGKQAVRVHDNFIQQFPDLLIKATSMRDLERARTENKIAVFYLFQNSTQFGRKIERVNEFYQMGVRSAQLTYNYQNWVGAGCKETSGSGLTHFGQDVVTAMNKLGMLIDLSHANERTMLDAISFSAQPTIISHTACSTVYTNERNTSDTVLKALANSGGVVGICQIRPFLTDKGAEEALPDYFRHIEHAVKVAGVEHVGIGSDRDHRVITMTDDYLKELAREEGENFDIKKWPLFIDELNGPSRMEVIVDGLQKRGFGSSDIDKIMGQNIARLYQQVIG